MVLSIGVVNETSEFESRVGLTPDVVARALKTSKREIEFRVEKGSGVRSTFSDDDFVSAGAKTVTRKDALEADIVGFIKPPSPEDIRSVKKGAVVVGLFNTYADEKIVAALKKAKVTAIDMSRLPRQLSMAQSMDAMTSQASVAGYKAVLLAASKFTGLFPMLSSAAGTVKPASVLILGAGIAGLSAVGTAKRLGAVVTAFDVRPAAEEEVQSLGAKFLDLGAYGGADVAATLRENQGEGGYARVLTDEELAKQKDATDRAIADFDIAITTASVPGKKPPEFISEAGLKGMKAGSVVIDLAASELGGNVQGSKPERELAVGGVTLIGAPSLASTSAKSASNLLARNVVETILHFVNDASKFELKSDDELLQMVIADPEFEKFESEKQVKDAQKGKETE